MRMLWSATKVICLAHARTISRYMASRSYSDAIDSLNSLQSNASTLEALKASRGKLSDYAIPEMLEYLHRIGYSEHDLNQLNVIHITGTKGKGSTCAFVSSILRQERPDWKIGLYTSPHLVAVRERIMINGMPITEDEFSKYFFEVWDRLEANPITTTPKPNYFRFLTLVAFHAFLEMKVDATILEVGVGGLHDSTNIVPKPVVTGVSSLGLDHLTVLGSTLGEIAFQKGGIFKEGVPAFSVEQPKEGAAVLKQQAEDRRASNYTVTRELPGLRDIPLGLAGQHQYLNANLAVHLCSAFLAAQKPPQANGYSDGAGSDSAPQLTKTVVEGLKRARWPGRCQEITDPSNPKISWFLDGAHTAESLQCCLEWFVSPDHGLRKISGAVKRVLILNCTSGRSGATFLKTIFSTLTAQLAIHSYPERPVRFFDHVVFCTNITYADGHSKGDLTKIPSGDVDIVRTQRELSEAFAKQQPDFPTNHIHVLPSIEHATNLVKELQSSQECAEHILVTGSLHLVGGVMEVAGLSEAAFRTN